MFALFASIGAVASSYALYVLLRGKRRSRYWAAPDDVRYYQSQVEHLRSQRGIEG